MSILVDLLEAAPMASRRHFLKAALGAGLATLMASCKPADPLAHVRVKMMNPDAGTGHLLRNPARLPKPTGEVLQTDVLIVGGGISGLSALRTLRNAGVKNMQLLELEPETGGNSVAGSNEHSRYPWAAHYLPVPDVRNTALLRFLEECGSIVRYENGLPVYNEYHLCSDPEERLFINGFWQEGLIPHNGITSEEKAEIARFFQLVDKLRHAKGADDREVFCIPQSAASRDQQALALDGISFASWLDGEDFQSKPLRWYLDYCCMDDYGLRAGSVSAWAGLHYLAGRKGAAANAGHSDLLTWPEGNAFLTESLRKGSEPFIKTGCLVYNITEAAERKGYIADVYDVLKRRSYRLACRELILATPHFIGSRLFPGKVEAPKVAHVPWMVANLTLKQLPQSGGQGQSLCWDNVLYGASSVGYVNARHQQPGVQNGPVVITYYRPLTEKEPQAARREAFSRMPREWLQLIVDELSIAHHGFATNLIEAEIRVWGHGMAGPLPGFRNPANTEASANFELAHTDYSGISIFEEAFYQGLNAAESVLKRLS